MNILLPIQDGHVLFWINFFRHPLGPRSGMQASANNSSPTLPCGSCEKAISKNLTRSRNVHKHINVRKKIHKSNLIIHMITVYNSYENDTRKCRGKQ